MYPPHRIKLPFKAEGHARIICSAILARCGVTAIVCSDSVIRNMAMTLDASLPADVMRLRLRLINFRSAVIATIFRAGILPAKRLAKMLLRELASRKQD
jgi:hypothetical protein